MNFEWDEQKREGNLTKHGIDFALAGKIFDTSTVERLDDRDDYGETRYIAIGHTAKVFLVVVYTWRGDTRRIISAWRAGRDEEETYHQNFTG